MPKVSVVVPVYNVEAYLPKCYGSILAQNLEDYEVIFVDDESPDGCPMLLDEWAKSDPHVKVIHKRNGGVSRARNDGMAAAQGDYLFFMDSDDWLAEGALRVLLDTALETNADIVMSDHFVSSQKGDVYVSMFSNEFVTTDREDIDLIQCAVMNMGPARYAARDFAIKAGSAAPWHHFFKSALIKENGLEFDANLKGLFDDGLFTLNALEYANVLAYVAVPSYHYRIVDSSLTQGYNPALKDKFAAVFAALESFVAASNNEQLMRAIDLRVYAYLNKAVDDIFLNAQNPASEKERYREFRDLAKSEPFRSALAQLPIDHLGKRRSRILARLLKLHQYRLYWMLKKMA